MITSPVGLSVSIWRNQRLQCGGRRVAALKAARDRMALAEIGDSPALKGFFDDATGRRGGQHVGERRAVEAALGGIVGAGSDEQRAAIAHIAGDIVEIEDRQHAALGVAVEDDQIELVDLDREELAGREGDQRQFVDRRAVLLFRRPQDGEMDEIDRGVGFQQIAPDALAGMRFAGDEQHAQILADAVDDRGGAVVDGGQFAIERRGLEFVDVLPGMGDVDIEAVHRARLHDLGRQRLAVARDGDAHRPRIRAVPVSTTLYSIDLFLADDGKARRRCGSRAGGRSRLCLPEISACSGAPPRVRPAASAHRGPRHRSA